MPKVNCYRIICRGEIQISTYNRGKAVGPVANKRCTVERSICLFFSYETIQKTTNFESESCVIFIHRWSLHESHLLNLNFRRIKSTGWPKKTFVLNLFEGEGFGLCSSLSDHLTGMSEHSAKPSPSACPQTNLKQSFLWDTMYFNRPKFSLPTSHPCSNIMVV